MGTEKFKKVERCRKHSSSPVKFSRIYEFGNPVNKSMPGFKGNGVGATDNAIEDDLRHISLSGQQHLSWPTGHGIVPLPNTQEPLYHDRSLTPVSRQPQEPNLKTGMRNAMEEAT